MGILNIGRNCLTVLGIGQSLFLGTLVYSGEIKVNPVPETQIKFTYNMTTSSNTNKLPHFTEVFKPNLKTDLIQLDKLNHHV